MLLWFSTAFAADPTPGGALPSAAPVARGEVQVSLTGVHYRVALFGADEGAGAAIRVGAAPTDALWVEVAVGMVAASWYSCGLYGGCSETRWRTGTALAAAARLRLLDDPNFSVAPVVVGFADPLAGSWYAGGGLGLEGGSRRVRADLTVVVGPGMLGQGVGVDVVPVGELGVTFRVGAAMRHALRIGVAELVPDLSYRYEADRWFVEAGITGAPFAAGAERVQLGARF